MKDNKGFNLITVIILLCVVSVVSGLTAGIVVSNTYRGVDTNDAALNEFLKAYTDIVNNYYEDIDKEEMLDKAMDAILDYLGDNYTTYLNSEEREALEEQLSSTYRGIGVSFLNKMIMNVTEGSPAEAAGLMAGDIFVRINGQDVEYLNDSLIGELIKGSKEKMVAITVSRNGQEMTFSVEIKTLEKSVIAYEMIPDTTIGYVDIPIFAQSLSSQVSKALTEMETLGMTGLIIDLRDDSGGYLEEAQKLASVFLEKGKLIYSLEDKNGTDEYYDETDESKNYPIVVLLNGNSASAAEILAGALKDSYGATIVGMTSYGKGKVQQTYKMSDGNMAKYTTARWFRPDGSCIDGKGIRPDYIVDIENMLNENGEEIKIDTQFNKALELLNN